MASANDLITAVASELNRTDLDTSGANVAVSQRAVNDSLRDLFNRYAWSWRIVSPPLSVPTVAGTSVYDLSSASYGSHKIQDLYDIVLDTGGLQTRRLLGMPHGSFIAQWGNLAYLPTNYPVAYTRRDQNVLVIAPRPASVYTLSIFYSEEFADITTFSATLTQVPARYLEVLKVMMLARLYRWQQEEQRAGSLYGLQEKMIGDLIREDKSDPSREFIMQPAVFSGRVFRTEYWASPFVRDTF